MIVCKSSDYRYELIAKNRRGEILRSVGVDKLDFQELKRLARTTLNIAAQGFSGGGLPNVSLDIVDYADKKQAALKDFGQKHLIRKIAWVPLCPLCPLASNGE